MNKRFLAGFLLITLLIAGFGSFYASAHPDGLEFVAEKTGFGDSAEEHHNADSPMADYQTKGIDNPRVSGGVAGVAGSLLVLLIGGGLFWVIRRRGSET